MNKLSIFVLCALLITPYAKAQQHSPTLATCQADQAVWGDLREQTDYFTQETRHTDSGAKNTNAIAKLGLVEINLRMVELADCESVDRDNRQDYYETLKFYSAVQADRYNSFLTRHHLIGKLMAEDEAGLR